MRPLRLLPALALLAGACFDYRPVTGAAPMGGQVEAVLSDTGTTNLTPRLGPNAASLLGTVVAVRGDTLDISIAEVRTRDGLTYYLKGSTVPVLRSDLASLSVRTFNKRRTIVAATVGVLGAAAIAGGVQAISGGSDNTGGTPPTPAARPPE